MTDPDTSNKSPASTRSLAWTPPARVDRVLRFLTQVVTMVGTAVCLLIFAGAGELIWSGIGPLFGWMVGILLIYIAVALHELGHLAGARAAGMHPVLAYCGPLQLMAQRRGFRWRWKRLKRDKRVPLAGVIALPDPDKRFGPQFAWIAAGGPIGNLAVGGLCFALGAQVPDGAWRGFAYGFAFVNLWLGVGNLIPSTIRGGTDGLHVLRAWRMNESDPSLALVRLNALAVTGTTADKLPVEELENLRAIGGLAGLLHLWFVLKGLQNQARWHEAAAMNTELDRQLSALSDGDRKMVAEHVALMTCEIRFSALMAEGAGGSSPVDALTPETDWLNPSIRPRCRAAMAALAGDATDASRWLEVAERHASCSADKAQRISEERMRAAIQSLLARTGQQSGNA
jgi:hypothetical protein